MVLFLFVFFFFYFLVLWFFSIVLFVCTFEFFNILNFWDYLKLSSKYPLHSFLDFSQRFLPRGKKNMGNISTAWLQGLNNLRYIIQILNTDKGVYVSYDLHRVSQLIQGFSLWATIKTQSLSPRSTDDVLPVMKT